MWWIVIVLALGLGGIYCALRLYINTLLFKGAKFQLILDKLQRETESILIDFNRITDRNVTIVEENIIKLNALIQQSKKQITRLSRAQAKIPPQLGTDDSPRVYSPQSVAQNTRAQRESSQDNDSVRAHIVRLVARGMDKEEIADRVGVSVSEVEMVSVMYDD